MALHDSWYVIAWSAEIANTLVARKALGEDLVIFRQESGAVVVMEDACPHRFLPLSRGKVVGDVVQCGYHGLQFDASGSCVRVPGQDRVPPQARVRTYPAVERYKWVWIWPGNPSDAEPSLIPDCHWMDDPDWSSIGSYINLQARYELMNDNLLDLSHLAYVHSGSIGNPAVAETPVAVEVLDDDRGGAIYARREIRDCEPPPSWKEWFGNSRIDRTLTTIFRPPSFHVIESRAEAVGSAAAGKAKVREHRIYELLTPEMETSCHYFFGQTFNRGGAELSADWLAAQQKNIATVYQEDRAVVEAQQASLLKRGLTGDRFPVSVVADGGATQGRRLLERWLKSPGIAATSRAPLSV